MDAPYTVDNTPKQIRGAKFDNFSSVIVIFMPVGLDRATLSDSPNSLLNATLIGTIAAMVGINKPNPNASTEALAEGSNV